MRKASGSLLILTVLAAAMVNGPSVLAEAEPDGKGLSIHNELPRDPLAVIAFRVIDARAVADGALALIGEDEDPLARAMALFDGHPGHPLAEQVLSQLGPEMAISFDLGPIDEVATAYAVTESLGPVLARIGLVAGVRDVDGTRDLLERLFVTLGGESEDEDGVTRTHVTLAETGDTMAQLTFFWGLAGDRLALGFTRDWVEAGLAGVPEGERLIDGEDYRRVAGSLDPDPSTLTYVNLPRLHSLVSNSNLVRMVMAQDDEARIFVEHVFNSRVMNVGLGSTSVVEKGGVRTASFGPRWLSGPALASGLVAALALPGWMQAREDGKALETLEDIRTIATACEGFSVDAQGYPGPTDGWVPIEMIATHLEPIYIGLLPRQDAWKNPILYWSNGRSYRIISLGQDGQMDQDWTEAEEPMASNAFDGDIVWGDGRFLAVPAQLAP